VEPSVVEETRDRGQRYLRSVHIDEASDSLTIPCPLVDYVGERSEFWLHLDDNGMITEVGEMLATATAPDTPQ
jgi:hypothetical protein